MIFIFKVVASLEILHGPSHMEVRTLCYVTRTLPFYSPPLSPTLFSRCCLLFFTSFLSSLHYSSFLSSFFSSSSHLPVSQLRLFSFPLLSISHPLSLLASFSNVSIFVTICTLLSSLLTRTNTLTHIHMTARTIGDVQRCDGTVSGRGG